MTVKLGDKTRSTRRPANLDDQLIATTGFNADETKAALSGHPLASSVASALRPFLGEDAPSVPELAGEIAAHGTEDARNQVLALYAAIAETAAPVKPAGAPRGE